MHVALFDSIDAQYKKIGISYIRKEPKLIETIWNAILFPVEAFLAAFQFLMETSTTACHASEIAPLGSIELNLPSNTRGGM